MRGEAKKTRVCGNKVRNKNECEEKDRDEEAQVGGDEEMSMHEESEDNDVRR